MLLEMASFAKQDPSFRARWIEDMGDTLHAEDRIRAVCWFENNTHCDWRLSTQDASVRAWGRQMERFGHL